MEEASLRCPVSTCCGWVSFVEDDDGDFWGCGECGQVWYSRDELNESIAGIVAVYSYRKNCYRKKAGSWIAADPSKESDDYDDMVAEEEDLGEGDDEFEDDELFCCPSWGCDGTVCWCEDGPSPEETDSGWYCDTCEGMWPARADLDAAISRIIKRGAHRKQLYEQSGSTWRPIGDSEDWEKVIRKHES